MKDNYLAIGEITKPQGVRGEVKVRPCTCDPGRFEGLETVYIERDGGYAPLSVTVNPVANKTAFSFWSLHNSLSALILSSR